MDTPQNQMQQQVHSESDAPPKTSLIDSVKSMFGLKPKPTTGGKRKTKKSASKKSASKKSANKKSANKKSKKSKTNKKQ
jgi:hypothetical protein